MASTVTVFESAAKRAVIKVSPGKYLHEVRAEACEKFRLDPDKYGLKHNNKTIDVSSQFRLSGLPPGAKLELVQLSRSAGVVNVAIQLPESEAQNTPNGRLSDKFPSTTTLWQVLRKFEDGVAGGSGSRNLTARGVPKMAAGGEAGAGRLYYEQPVMTIMNRDYSSFVELQKTLSSLGFSGGSVLVRLAYRVSEQPLEEAQEQIGKYFDEVEGSRKELESSKQDEEQAEAAAQQPPNPSQAEGGPIETDATIGSSDTSIQPTESTPDPDASIIAPAPMAIDGVSERPITVFTAPSNTTPKAASATYNPNDYEFTIDHAKTQAAMYQAAGRNKPLPSDAELEAQKAAAAAKVAAIRSVQIKVRFPDQTSVVSDFKQQDVGRDLYDWVRGLMQNGDAPFALKWAGPKGMADVPSDDKKLIQEIGMTGRVQVTLTWKEGAGAGARNGPVLKDRVNQIARELEVKDIPGTSESEAPSGQKPGTGQQSGEKKKGALPAWLKKSLPGKK